MSTLFRSDCYTAGRRPRSRDSHQRLKDHRNADPPAALKATAEAAVKAKGEDSPEAFTAGMLAGMIDQMNISLTLNADGTATMNNSMMGQTQTITGTWTLDGNAISITAAGPGQASQTISGTLSGDVITLKPPQDQQMPFDLVFKKKPA